MTSITGISSMATRQLLAELTVAFEQQHGLGVQIEAVGGVDAAKRVQSGEAFDVVVLAANVIDNLIAAGHLLPASRVDLVRSSVSVAVPAGAALPDISTEEAVRQAVLAAPSISYSTGPSGTHLIKLFERWGIAADVQPKLVQAPPGVPVGSLVARGEVALGFQQLSELINLQGISIVGPLPPAIQILTTFSAGIGSASTQPENVRRLLDFMASPQADESKRRQGMEPARA